MLGCADVVPSEFESSQAYTLPSLPLHSWQAAITLHLHRLASSLGLDNDSSAIVGLDEFVHAIKSISGWAGWVGDELGSAIGWSTIKVPSLVTHLSPPSLLTSCLSLAICFRTR